MSDPRSRRIAVVADSLLEPLFDELGRKGFGVIQLPTTGLDRETVAIGTVVTLARRRLLPAVA